MFLDRRREFLERVAGLMRRRQRRKKAAVGTRKPVMVANDGRRARMRWKRGTFIQQCDSRAHCQNGASAGNVRLLTDYNWSWSLSITVLLGIVAVRGFLRRFAHPRVRDSQVTISLSAVHAARAAHRRGEHTSWEGAALPNPSIGWGYGETWFPHTPARAAIRCNEGDGPLPSPPPLGEGVRLLPPAGGGWEGGRTRRTVFTSAVHAACAAPRRDEHTSWEGVALPNPSIGWGYGGTRFPHVHVRAAKSVS